MPRAGRYAVTDGTVRSELNTADRSLHQRHVAAVRDHETALQSQLQRLGIPLLQASTDAAPLTLLQTYYGQSRR